MPGSLYTVQEHKFYTICIILNYKPFSRSGKADYKIKKEGEQSRPLYKQGLMERGLESVVITPYHLATRLTDGSLFS
jgi:hypothetical protein